MIFLHTLINSENRVINFVAEIVKEKNKNAVLYCPGKFQIEAFGDEAINCEATILEAFVAETIV